MARRLNDRLRATKHRAIDWLRRNKLQGRKHEALSYKLEAQLEMAMPDFDTALLHPQVFAQDNPLAMQACFLQVLGDAVAVVRGGELEKRLFSFV